MGWTVIQNGKQTIGRCNMDEHILLDLIAQSEIVLKGIQYGVLVQDIDIVRKAVIDLKEFADTMDSIVENDFGE